MMKRLRFLVLATLVAIRAASAAAQSAMPTPAPATMPATESAMPISSSGLVEPGYDSTFAGYPGDYSGVGGNGYCGDPSVCQQSWGGGVLRSCTGRGYFQVDAMLLNRNDAAPTSIVTQTISGVAVNRISGNTPWFGFETLPRLTAGYVLPNDTAIEATAFYKDDFDCSAGYGLTAGTMNVVGDGTGFTRANLGLSTAIHNIEINMVETGRIFNCLAGVRWLEIEDHMFLTAANGIPPAAPTTVNNTTINTYNSMIGGQGGGRFSMSKGLFTWEGTGKAGLFYNNGSMQSRTQVGAPAATPATNQAKSDCESFVGELNTMLTFRPTASVALRAGYQVMWICNTALAVDQFFNGTSIYTAGARSLNDRGDIILHGPSAGVDVRW